MLVSELQLRIINILSILVIRALSIPTKNATFDSGSPPHSQFMRLPRSFRPKPHIPYGTIRIFDPTYAQAELRGILGKYEQASHFLHGIGLNPELDITATYPFASDLIPPFPTNVSSSAIFYEPEKDSSSAPPLIPPVRVPSAGTAVMPMKDCMSGTLDVLYYGPLEFGTPSQRLTVDVDTGSADLWVPVACAGCENKQFTSMMSSTYENWKQKFAVSYGFGAVRGTLATDVVSISGLTVESQAFGAVSIESNDFNSYPNSGLFGMAFGTIAQSKKATMFENLVSEKKVAAPLFSIHLSRNQETGSEVCFGCYDATKTTGPVSWVPVKSKTYWSVAMGGLTINSTLTVATDIVAAIDTGTTLIYIPDDITAQFYSLIPNAKPAPQYGPEFYTYPCASTLSLSLSFGGKHFAINVFDFNLGRTAIDSPDCVGGILSLGNDFPSNFAIIGDEFLKSWYSTYDYSNGARVGFSPSVNNNH